MHEHFALINKLTTKAGNRDQVIDILLESGKSFDANPSCLLYLVSKDLHDPNVIWVQDLWVTKEAHTVAMANPAMRPLIMKAMSLLEGMPTQIEVIPAGGKGPK